VSRVIPRASATVRVAFAIRRFARATAGAALGTAACALVAGGWVGHGRPGPLEVAAAASLLLILGGALAARLRFREPTARAQQASWMARTARTFVDLHLGLALLAGAFALVEVTGGVGSGILPLVYLVVAFSATFLESAAAAAVTAAALTLVGTAAARAGHPLMAAPPAAFVLLAAVSHALFLRGLVAWQRRRHAEHLASEARAMRDEAREFRLISAALGAESRARRPREEEEQKLAAGAVETIHASLFYTLELLKESMDLTTCVLLWLDEEGSRLRIKELVTDSDAVVETPIQADAGALGAIVRDRLLLNLPQPKRGHVPYYDGPDPVGSFLGVPVLEDGHLRGVLCADRRGGRPFGEPDEALLAGAAHQILRAIQSERIFAAVERSKYEHERFYHASAELGRALTLDQVMDTAFGAAKEICAFDMASIALFDRERKRHRVSRVQIAPGAEGIVDMKSLDGHEFGDSAGLASMVVKNKHYLPAGGELRDPAMPVFSRKVKLKGVESLLVLPLISADEAIGSFTLAAKRAGAFGKEARDMLGVIANQVAVSLQNAKMYQQMERMATTDGLTGLLNHRTFQEKLDERLERVARTGQKVALILTDIDHFKKVNDTYGHPMGDEILRRVAKVLGDSMRKIDVVARYGGEEFAIVIEGADAEGAKLLADRIRLDVPKQVVHTDKGPLSVTLSLGIACVPDDAQNKQSLIERADQSLYHAKHNGRNRAVTYQQMTADRMRKVS
jgi:two-component system, cell cycle response regulator